MRRYVTWSSTTLAVLGLELLVTTGLIAFYLLAAPALRQNAVLQQTQRAEAIKRDLEANLLISQQVVRSTAGLAAPIRGDPRQVEQMLTAMLRSTPAATVYGIGAWYEPNVFTPTARLFGPYVHRQSFSDPSPLLTYEWTTEDYNFPSQPWYVATRDNGGKTLFTEPYFDTDLVYMSIIHPFTDTAGRFTGMTSVDLVLPQLQAIVMDANADPALAIYLVSSQGALLAHPDETALLAFARERGTTPQSLLDLGEPDLAAFADAGPAGRRHTDGLDYATVVGVEPTGWRLHIVAAEAEVFKSLARLRYIVIIALLIAWAGGGAILAISRRSRARMRKAHATIEQGEKKYSELFNYAPYPIALLDRDSGRFALVNDAALDFYGYSEAEFSQMALWDLLPAAEAAELAIPARYSESGGLFEDRHSRKNGRIADVVVRAQAVEIEGKPYLKCYILDSSERKQAEEQVAIQRSMIRDQETAIAQASTPLIPISDQIVALPLIGSVDAGRARQVLELVARELERSRARVLILDVTGVSSVDQAVADLLIRAARTARLLGARSVITGIQPDVAQSLVSLGVDLDDLVAHATLQSGIAYAMAELTRTGR